MVFLCTHFLTTEEYGRYTVFQSWRDVIIIFASLNLYCGIYTKAMVDHPDDRDRYTSSMQGLSTVSTIVLAIVYFSLHGLWNRLLDMDTVTMSLMFIYFVFYPSFLFWSVRQRVENKYRRMVSVTLCNAVLVPGISLILLYGTGLRDKAIIWGFLIVQTLFGLFFYVLQFIRGKAFFVKEYWKHGLTFNIPLIPHYLSLIILNEADRLMIKYMVSTDKAGIYSLAYSVAMLMNIFVGAINSAFVPWFYERLNRKEYSAIAPVSNTLCIFVGFLTFGAMLVSPEIIRILGTEEYLQAIWIVPAVVLSVYLTFCYGLFSNIEFYYDATKYVMIASTVGAVVNIVLNAIFIRIYGFIAAGYTTLVCYSLFAAMHYIFMKSVLRKNEIKEKILDHRFMIGSMVFLFGLMVLCLVLYNSIWIRYGLILIMFVLAVIFRKKVIAVIKKIRG